MQTPKILTIILNFRTPELTLRAAEAALREMELLSGEVLVVDNGSGDDSFEMLCTAAEDRGWLQDNRLRVVSSGHNGGFGAGNNFGIKTGLANGTAPDFYYLLNSDAFPEPSAVRHLRDFLTANSGAGMAGSYLRGVDGDPHPTAFRFPSIGGEFEDSVRTGIITRLLKDSVVSLPIPTKPIEVDWTAGASLMIRRTMLEQIGCFDETFFLYFEETELCHRAKQAGWRTHYLPQSEVVHVGSASTGMKSWARTPQYWFDSRDHYFTKTHGRGYAIGAALARISGGLIWQLRRLISNKPPVDPPWFLWDLVAHSVRNLTRPRHSISSAPNLFVPITEDPK
jgi:GT2 family glycosyltransferase